jgi:predicted RNase H-like HicB family nuclease
MAPYHINVEWDEEGQVWLATSEDVPGLVTGAETLEALIEKLRLAVPELLEENGLIAPGAEPVPFAITAERTELGRRAA